ncbi:MAG: septum formation family protein [Nocardioidaceae bacterium]|nr:septum formation family protein [Nocardioidaceae bacterium]MCL2611904.1 septum formation family protein [Nocardioidaceae bacterium]
MTKTLLRLGAPAAVLLVLMAAAGCGSGTAPSPSASASKTAAPVRAPAPPPAPKNAACYRLTMKQEVAPTSSAAATPCSRTHTSETYFVGQLDTQVDGHLVAVDSDRVGAQVASTCRDRLDSFLGGSADDARLSMVHPVWFTPSVGQSDKGANWFRCDAVVTAGGNLTSRTQSLKGAMKSSKSRDGLSMCGTDAPDAKDFHRVPCAAHHSWRAIAVVPLKKGAYPGVKAAKSAGQTTCQNAAAHAAADPLSYQWGYEYPTKKDWDMDQQYGICWTKGS